MTSRSEDATGVVDKKYVLDRHEAAAAYYWRASRANKRNYKLSRYLTIVLAALVTLIASLASADFITGSTGWDRTFAIATPVLAALLAIVTGFAQAFHWGAAWREMVLAAERIEKEIDRLKATPEAGLDTAAELAALNDLVIGESEQFFERITGTSRAPVMASEGNGEEPGE